jgi:SUMO ligase MMS21 Smc5/6 complex component
MKKTAVTALIIMIIAGCVQQGPISPRQSMSSLKKAYRESDVQLFLSLITDKSREYLTTNTDIFNELAPETRKKIYKNAGLDFDENTPLSIDQYLTLYFACNHKIEKDIIARALESRIVAMDETETTVVFTMSTELDLRFELQDPYWKFDYSSVYE